MICRIDDALKALPAYGQASNAKISGTMAVPRGAEQDRGGQLEVNRAERKELSGEETP
jgi:hypothetical protein